jgi:hypothetical protein
VVRNQRNVTKRVDALGRSAMAAFLLVEPNGRALSGEPRERSERPERTRGRRVRGNAVLGGLLLIVRAAIPSTVRFQRSSQPHERANQKTKTHHSDPEE